MNRNQYKTENYYMNQLQELRKKISDAWNDGSAFDIIRTAEEEYGSLMKKADIIKQHPYSITKQKDGRWTTYYKDPETGDKKRVRKQTEKELLDALVALYQLKDEAATIGTVYTEWQEDMQLRGHSSTAVRYHYDWERYLKNSEFVNLDLRKLKASRILKGLMDISNEHNLTMRKFRDLKSIVNGVLDYAVANDLVDRNRARDIHHVSQDVFQQEEGKSDEEQVYSEEEQESFVRECFRLYERFHNPSYLAIILNFYLGLRAGELCALKLDDFDFHRHVLTAQRSEIKNKTINNGTVSSAGTKIVNHLKSGHKKREIIIDPEATEAFVRYIVEKVEATGQNCDEWLFTRPDGERMTESNIMHAMQNVNRNVGIKQRGNHAIRKTVVTRLIQSRLFSTTDIARQAGHNSYETTQKYYAFALREESGKSERVGKALVVDIESLRREPLKSGPLLG